MVVNCRHLWVHVYRKGNTAFPPSVFKNTEAVDWLQVSYDTRSKMADILLNVHGSKPVRHIWCTDVTLGSHKGATQPEASLMALLNFVPHNMMLSTIMSHFLLWRYVIIYHLTMATSYTISAFVMQFSIKQLFTSCKPVEGVLKHLVYKGHCLLPVGSSMKLNHY